MTGLRINGPTMMIFVGLAIILVGTIGVWLSCHREETMLVSFNFYGSLSPNSWYFVYRVRNGDDFDLLLTKTMRHELNRKPPEGLTYEGSIRTDSQGLVVQMKQIGEEFSFK
jgi:hypothetical protein